MQRGGRNSGPSRLKSIAVSCAWAAWESIFVDIIGAETR